MLSDIILIHYGEIALKGNNRPFFESALIKNIKSQLHAFAPGSYEQIKKLSGGILVKLTAEGINQRIHVQNALDHTFGISNYYFCVSVSQEINQIKKACWNLIKNNEFHSFRITTNRSDKKFPTTSAELNAIIGEYIFNKLKHTKKVDLKNPGLNCYINIIEKEALISIEKMKGLGGMPVGTTGRAIVLISGGFDSPVAAWNILRRGVQLRFVHFHSLPYTSKASLEKVTQLVEVLSQYGANKTIYMIPFADAQKEIILKTPEKLRVIFYRRMMVRIAEKIAFKEKALALITGDSIAQVASQTMENIFAVSEAARMPIFRPLIGMDKEDIMNISKVIGTYDISKLPHEDCCMRLMPRKVETKARMQEVLEAEKNLDIEKIVIDCFRKMQ